MQIIVSIIFFFCAIGAIGVVKSLELSAGLTAAIVIPLVLLVVYILARIPPAKDAEEEEMDRKSVTGVSKGMDLVEGH